MDERTKNRTRLSKTTRTTTNKLVSGVLCVLGSCGLYGLCGFLWGITFIKYRCVLLCIVLIVVSSVEGGGGCVGVVPTFSKWFFDDFSFNV